MRKVCPDLNDIYLIDFEWLLHKTGFNFDEGILTRITADMIGKP